jgi:hypothetical protein
MLSRMRSLAIVACLSACVSRVDTTRVTLRDPSELATSGSGTLPLATDKRPVGLADHDVVLVGRPADVLAFDGDQLHMRFARRGALALRLDTPLANVRAIHAVGVVANHAVIPLGVLAGGLLAGLGGAMLVYEHEEHVSGSMTPAALAVAFGVAILAIEIHARLARDTVTVVR